jgi:hypothetical protein
LILSPLLVTNQSVQAVNGCYEIIFFSSHQAQHFLFQEGNDASLEEFNI